MPQEFLEHDDPPSSKNTSNNEPLHCDPVSDEDDEEDCDFLDNDDDIQFNAHRHILHCFLCVICAGPVSNDKNRLFL